METFFYTPRLKLWDVEVLHFFFFVPRNFIPLTTLVPEALGALFIDYFVCHDGSIKIDDLIKAVLIIRIKSNNQVLNTASTIEKGG